MEDIPPIVFIAPLIGIVAVVMMVLRRKSAMKDAETRYANFRVADLAQRMGLALVEGDPAFNMMLAHAAHGQKDYTPTGGVLGKITGDGVKETRVRLAGSPYGHPTEFVYYSRHEYDGGIASATIRTRFECRLSVRVAAAVPEFEVVLRAASAGFGAQPKLPLPPQSFGDAMLDQRLALTSRDARVGPALAPVVGGLTPLQFVHVQGSDGAVHALATENGSSMAIYHLEQVQQVLEQIANVLEGRPPLARPAAATAAAATPTAAGAWRP
jgi:hypothetical protein